MRKGQTNNGIITESGEKKNKPAALEAKQSSCYSFR